MDIIELEAAADIDSNFVGISKVIGGSGFTRVKISLRSSADVLVQPWLRARIQDGGDASYADVILYADSDRVVNQDDSDFGEVNLDAIAERFHWDYSPVSPELVVVYSIKMVFDNAYALEYGLKVTVTGTT